MVAISRLDDLDRGIGNEEEADVVNMECNKKLVLWRVDASIVGHEAFEELEIVEGGAEDETEEPHQYELEGGHKLEERKI